MNSLLPKIPKEDIPLGTAWEIVEHDFSRGPWWPSQTVVSNNNDSKIVIFSSGCLGVCVFGQPQ